MSLGALDKIAEASHANAQVMKRIKEAEAIDSGASAAIKALDNPIPILKWIDYGAVIAATAAQVAIIEGQHMWNGGIVQGGTQGRDSVPTMLAPGELVYNPAAPNAGIASMITNNNNSSDTHMHVYGPTINVNGSVSQKTLDSISQTTQRATNRALKSGIRQLQSSGKLSGITLHN